MHAAKTTGLEDTGGTALSQYRIREAQASKEAAAAARAMHVYSNVRFGIFVVAVAALVWTVQARHGVGAVASLVGGAGAFFLAVVRHNRVTEARDRAQALVEINREGILRCTGEWDQRKVKGAEFLDRTHPYAADLDLFGEHSVFQWCNTARTMEGRAILARMLLASAAPEEIAKRQPAVTELAGKLDWRQHLELTAMTVEGKSLDGFCHWSEEDRVTRLRSRMARVICLWPVATLILSVALWLSGLRQIAVLVVGIQAAGAWLLAKPLQRRIMALLGWETQIAVSKSLVDVVERESFEATLLAEAKGTLGMEQGIPATGCLGRLESAVEWLAIRHNPFLHIPLHLLFLWDVQWMRVVEEWRARHGAAVRKWLGTVAQLEALNSLAVIRYEHPDWAMPLVSPGNSKPLLAEGVGHPLLPDAARVTNDFQIDRPGCVALITGSNMSGKSTFMRSIGINLVLAGAGAPVCATRFECVKMSLYTSMRIADDLRSGVSSFYAELLRIKMIVDAAKDEQKPVMYLIDEIFRGTNSGDRIAGATAVLKTLSQGPAVGLVSTHDLELGKLEAAQPDKFTNYHFTERYTENGIEFSYKILPGPSTTTNARHLIRLVGIDV